MSAARMELQQVLCRYVTDTLTHINTVRRFCEDVSKWGLGRETELNMMKDIKERADRIDQNGKTFWEYLKSKVTQMTADSRRAELQKELDAVLKDTLVGLEKLDCFLVAVEKLAVTSLHVFTENQALSLPKGITFDYVQVVITAARVICPRLLEFKRDAQVFFQPILPNVEVLSYELDKYIQTTEKICEMLSKSSFSDFPSEITMETVVNFDEDLPGDDMQRMLDHINQLDEIRMNKHFRMVYLFQEESCSDFITDFSKRQPRMLEFLNELEKSATQLDRMNMGAKISSVAGSSVGATGGVLSIVGLALMPVTAGLSLALTATGIGLGITSGVNSLVTTATEIGVNATQQKKAREVFQSFMEDVQSLQECLYKVTSQADSKIEESIIEVALGISKGLGTVGAIGKGIDAIVDASSAIKLLKSEEVIAGVGKVVVEEGKSLRNVPRVAADIPDIGQAVAKGPLALSKSARAGLIAVNALFLGMDIFFICKDSISLAKGNKTEISLFIRSRATLWKSEMDSWQGIHDSLCEGLETSMKRKAVLETPFYPEMDVKEQREEDMEFSPDEK
nr:PREDICTED: apolipoprotein L2-like [Paralichthys olivaceus]